MNFWGYNLVMCNKFSKKCWDVSMHMNINDIMEILFLLHVSKYYNYNYLYKNQLVYFDQYKVDASFDQFLGPSTNNAYPKCTYLGCARSIEFVHMKKYLKF